MDSFIFILVLVEQLFVQVCWRLFASNRDRLGLRCDVWQSRWPDRWLGLVQGRSDLNQSIVQEAVLYHLD